MHGIKSVTVMPRTRAMVVEWDDGSRSVKDTAKQIETRRVFAPLADERLFNRVHVADERRAIRGTDDIDYCADALWLESEDSGRTPSTNAAE